MKTNQYVMMAMLGVMALTLPNCAFLRSWIYKESPSRNPPVAADPQPEPQPEPIPEPTPKPRRYTETPTAKWTDNVPNTVWSPYLDGSKVDVAGIAPGTLVADPNCPEPMKHLFYVPKVPVTP